MQRRVQGRVQNHIQGSLPQGGLAGRKNTNYHISLCIHRSQETPQVKNPNSGEKEAV